METADTTINAGNRDDFPHITITSLRVATVIRYIIILLGIGILLLRHPVKFFTLSVLGPYIIFIVAGIINTLFLVLTRKTRSPRFLHALAFTQITFDAIIISGLVFFTGGIFSAISSFYFAVILTASVLLSFRESMFFASLCIILFSVVHILYAMGIFAGLWEQAWQYPLKWGAETMVIVSKLLFHAAAFYTVSFLTGTLANMARNVRILNIEILENINEGLLVVDNQGSIKFFNRAFCRLFGFDQEKLPKDTPAEDLFSKDAFTFIKSIIGGDISKSGEYTIIQDGKPSLNLNIKATRLLGNRGALRGVIILFEDISANKEMEKALVRIDRYRAIVEMSAGIAHEIRNPLASIRGCAEELTSDEGITPENARLFDIIRTESDRLSDIISDFSNYLKESPPRKTLCNLNSIVEETVELAEQNPVFNDISFALDIEDLNLPLDRDQWKQVFLNLFLNASEALAEKIFITGKKISAENVTFARQFVSVEEIDYGVEVMVSDTGSGIAQDKLSNIFIPFYTTKENGIGVGLSVVNRIIRAHGGIIEIRSTGTSGTSFVIVLPVYKAQEVS